MKSEVILIAVAALIASALLTGAVRRLALRHGILDVPNERSSHDRVVPRGGGVAVFLIASIAYIVLAVYGIVSRELLLALLGGGTAVAAIGLLDDRYRVPASLRLVVHFAAAVWAVVCVGEPLMVRVGSQLVTLSWVGYAVAAIAIVWVLNLFNFMDGIDGIAASETVFVAFGVTASFVLTGITFPLYAVCLAFGAACLGFLLWNWPPAKIFMGDVGSGYMGYVVGVLTLAATRVNPSALWIWLILGGVFFVDATVTLLRRLLTGQKVYQAHRSHAYQHLVRWCGSHRRVTLGVIAVNILWLLPCALLAARYPERGLVIAIVTWVPLVIGAIAAGAGRRERLSTPAPC